MNTRLKIKRWQLIRCRSSEERLDLSEAEFVTVGKRAFRRGRQEAIVFPPSLSAVKTEAFVGCRRLKQVTLPADTAIGLSVAVFRGCERLHEVEHSEMISSVGERAFSDCQTLEEIRFGRDLRRIGARAFERCRALKTIVLPSQLQAIGDGAFCGCTELEHVTLESASCRLGTHLFRNCISLREVQLPTDLEFLPNGMFRDCSALEECSLPQQLKEIGAHAFDGCTRLSVVHTELGLQRIGAFAFAHTPRLREVFLSHTVKLFGFGAFGVGKRSESDKIRIYVENEYMVRRVKRMLLLCGSSGRATVCIVGKTIEERRRERRRTSLDSAPTHLMDLDSSEPSDTTEPTAADESRSED